jgi:hypothetical protein
LNLTQAGLAGEAGLGQVQVESYPREALADLGQHRFVTAAILQFHYRQVWRFMKDFSMLSAIKGE